VGVTPHIVRDIVVLKFSTLLCYYSCFLVFAYEKLILPQIDVVNNLQLLTAKPVTYLVNLSEKDYIRKKNKWRVLFLESEAQITLFSQVA
jgi:hypothetical protein